MRYNIKVGDLWLVGESATETIKGTVRGDTTAVFSRMVGEMSAYVFADHRKEAASFDRITLCDYLRGIVERQNYGHYLGEIKVIPEDEVEAQLPKRGKYVHGRELSREYIGDCLVSIDYEDWRCSVCGIVFEQWSIPKYNYCPNCGAKMMEVQE